jgi:hypothetical protein
VLSAPRAVKETWRIVQQRRNQCAKAVAEVRNQHGWRDGKIAAHLGIGRKAVWETRWNACPPFLDGPPLKLLRPVRTSRAFAYEQGAAVAALRQEARAKPGLIRSVFRINPADWSIYAANTKHGVGR